MKQTDLLHSTLLVGLLVVTGGILSGCSGSTVANPVTSEPNENASGSPVVENVTIDSTESVVSQTPETVNDQQTGPLEESPVSTVDSGNGDNTDPQSDGSIDATPGADEIPEPDAIPVSDAVPDPAVQNTTEVNFEVMVPAYQSNQLQLLLDWGEFSTSLNWIGDEFWSATATLPTNTEHLLSITFYDENGDIELGTYEQSFLTGTNAAEIYQVSAEQLNTNRWDNDNDGTSNLDELIAGTDPRLDEDSLLPVNDVKSMGLLFIANYFERSLQKERPYMGSELEEISERSGSRVTADIDTLGNGEMRMTEWAGIESQTQVALRTVSANAVGWEGRWSYYDGDYGLLQEFTSEVSVDGNIRRLVEETNGRWSGTYSDSWENTVDITGKLIEGSDYCEPVSGTITEVHRNNRGDSLVNSIVSTLTITREAEDDFWRVVEVRESSEGANVYEYFARELSMHRVRFGYQKEVSENDHFFCNFVDL